VKRFIIVGLGSFGSGVAESLHSPGHGLAALDTSEARAGRIAPYVIRATMREAYVKMTSRDDVQGMPPCGS
jgi:Trk K+ transport system NAD-binding subunit